MFLVEVSNGVHSLYNKMQINRCNLQTWAFLNSFLSTKQHDLIVILFLLLFPIRCNAVLNIDSQIPFEFDCCVYCEGYTYMVRISTSRYHK